MHHTSISTLPRTDELLALVGGLAEPERRSEAAAALARLLGGESLLLFAPDPELGVLLPAPGFSQVLHGAAEWQTFLAACAQEGDLSGTVPGPQGQPTPVCGCALPDGTAAVLVRPESGTASPAALCSLLPLLGALFRAERQITTDEVRARSAADAVERARVLTRSLQEMRKRLENALVEAQEARSEARERAELAESLALELEAQAEQLEEQAAELATMNAELLVRTEETERALAAADEANRAKSEFLAAMSHELRTPLNAIGGYADLIEMGLRGEVTREQRQDLKRIKRSQQHLLALVNDVLSFARIDAGRVEFHPVDVALGDLVAEVEELVGPQVREKGLDLRVAPTAPSLMVRADPERTRQILLNLLSNAIKFTAPGGRITVACEAGGEWVRVQVRDTGVGIPAEKLPHIFDAFVQGGRALNRPQEGVGLGLAISRDLALAMGGDLTAESTEGVGSVFTLRLPRS